MDTQTDATTTPDPSEQGMNEYSLLERLIWSSEQRLRLGESVEVITPVVILHTEYDNDGVLGTFRDPESIVHQWPIGFRWRPDTDLDEEYYELNNQGRLKQVPEKEPNRFYLPLCRPQTDIPITGFDQAGNLVDESPVLGLEGHLSALPVMLLWKGKKGHYFRFLTDTQDGLQTVGHTLQKEEWGRLYRFLTTIGEGALLPAMSEIAAPRTCVSISVPRRSTASDEQKIDWLVPSTIKQYLDGHVIGQEAAKRVAAVTASMYHQRLQESDPERKRLFPKESTLFIGPTGSGKTHIWDTLSKVLDIPFVKFPCVGVSGTGYVGPSITDPLEELLRLTGKEDGAGIILFDEIDKLGDTQIGNSQGYGPTLMKELVGFVEGSKVALSKGTFDTSNTLFVFAGAFETGQQSLYDLVRDRRKVHHLGFGDPVLPPAAPGSHEVTDQDLMQYRFIPELVGRIPGRAILDELTKDDLRRILTDAKENVLEQYSLLLRNCGYAVIIEPDAIDAIVEAAPPRTGARALNQVCHRLFARNILYEPQQYFPQGTARLTGDLVRQILNP